MNSNWKVVNLGDVVSYKKDFITIDELKNYKLCRVQTKVKGIILREEKIGFEIKTKKQQICNAGNLIFAEMDARFGGYGIIPTELDQAIVSSHYFLYEIDKTKIDENFLQYCLLQPSFFQQVVARGSTNYAAIRPIQVLNYKIPLPSFEEQKRVVAKLKTVEDNIKKIKELIMTQEREIKNFRFSFFEKCKNKYSTESLSKALELDIDAEEVDALKEYDFAGVYGFGKGLFVRGIKDGKTSYKVFHRLHKNHIVLSKVKGWEGAIAFITEEFEGMYLSPVYPTFKTKDDVNIRYTSEFLHLPTVWQILLDNSKGIGARRNQVSVDTFLELQIPLPPIEEQNRIVEIFENFSEIKRKHETTLKELEELFSSLLDKAFKGKI